MLSRNSFHSLHESQNFSIEQEKAVSTDPCSSQETNAIFISEAEENQSKIQKDRV